MYVEWVYVLFLGLVLCMILIELILINKNLVMIYKYKKYNFILYYFNDFGKYCKFVIIGIVFDIFNCFYLNYLVIKILDIRNFVIESLRLLNFLILLMFLFYLLKNFKIIVVEIYFRICYEVINLKKIN